MTTSNPTPFKPRHKGQIERTQQKIERELRLMSKSAQRPIPSFDKTKNNQIKGEQK